MTGRTSIHIAVDVYSRALIDDEFKKTSHCVIVFVSTDEDGIPTAVPKFKPETTREIDLYEYASKLVEKRKAVEEEMIKFRE